MKIYVPDLEGYSCYTIKDSNTIRAYVNMPENGLNVPYRDYFIHSDYYYKDGNEVISDTIPVCIEPSLLTDEVYYRVDFSNILIIFLIFSIFAFLIPLKVFLRFFRRFN